MTTKNRTPHFSYSSARIEQACKRNGEKNWTIIQKGNPPYYYVVPVKEAK